LEMIAKTWQLEKCRCFFQDQWDPHSHNLPMRSFLTGVVWNNRGKSLSKPLWGTWGPPSGPPSWRTGIPKS
jgi:hypothetical protein